MPNRPKPLVRTEGGRRTLEFTPGDIQSAMRLSRPSALVLAYARAMMCFAVLVPRPRHILLVGLGGGSMARFCHRHFPASRITVLELRADVIALREQFLVPPDDDRFRVIHADAATWMAGAGDAGFDVIVADGFDEAGLPPALSSRAFYEDCRRRLAPDGVLVVNVFSYDPRHDAVLDALERAFGGHTCRLDKVAGNNRIVFAGAATQGRAARRLPALRLECLNRLCVRLILARIAWRSVFA
ncbi:fused MFS/spermidine synthase [Massilia sp. LXY-6]|uniref:fused MFS/spermidine synthase n=1 Tax=Massilia sp. LXY-6 TaxID=3379823 RepID=UPI003EDFB4BA